MNGGQYRISEVMVKLEKREGDFLVMIRQKSTRLAAQQLFQCNKLRNRLPPLPDFGGILPHDQQHLFLLFYNSI